MSKHAITYRGVRWVEGFLAVSSIFLLSYSATAMQTVAAGDQGAPAAVNGHAAQLSPGLAEVLQMLDAKVDPEVVKTFVNNSTVAYNPSASEIIMLKEHGASNDMLTALLHRGGELRTRHIAAQPAPPQPAPGQVQPAYSYGPPADAAAAPSGSADAAYGYSYYPYPYYSYPVSYSYPYYYNYWPSFYASWYWPYYSCGYYGHGCYSHGYCGYGHYGYGYHGGFVAHGSGGFVAHGSTGGFHGSMGAVHSGGGGFHATSAGFHGGGGGGGHGGGGHR